MRAFFGMPSDGLRAVSKDGAYVLSPLEGAQSMSEPQNITEQSEWVIPADVIRQRTQAPSEQVKIFQIEERVMEPDFKCGEHVLVDTSNTHPAPTGAYVISDGFSYMIRFCEFVTRSDPPQIKISARDESISPKTGALEEFDIIGRVIAKLEWV